MSPLNWRLSPDNFIFTDDNLNTYTPNQTNGVVTITAFTPTPLTPTPTPTATPTPTPTPTPFPPTPTPTPTPGSLIVSLPTDNFDVSVPIQNVFIEPVTTTFIDPSLHYVGFQGDFTYDSAVIGFPTSGGIVQRAGLTSDPLWNLSASILSTGPGTIKTLRFSFLRQDFGPLNGFGTLFELRMFRVSNTPGAASALNWALGANQFVFVDENLDSHLPNLTNGVINITAPMVSISGSASSCSNTIPGPVPNVALTLNGSMSGSTSSDSSGNYQFSSLLGGGSYTVTPTKSAVVPGNSRINTVDMIAIQRHYLQLTVFTGCRLAAADCNGDGVVNTVDAIAIQQFFFAHPSVNIGKYRFNPASRSYSGITSDQTAQNYDTFIIGDVASPFVE